MNFLALQRLNAVLSLLAIALSFNSSPALAQSGQLPATFVTASRVEQPVTDVVADVSVIDRSEIELMGAGTITDLLNRLPGVQTITGADAARVYIRGADSRMTALYVDGVRVDTQDGAVRLGGGAPWELLSLSQIERVEVLRGPASAVYGSNAMGGVVQSFTRRGEAGIQPYASFGVSSTTTRKLTSGLSGSGQGWDYSLGLGIEDSDGINTRPDLSHNPSTEAYTQRNVNFHLGRQLSGLHRVDTHMMDSQLDSRYVPWNGGNDYQAKAHLNLASLKWRARWSETYSTDLSVSQTRIANRDDMPNDYVTTLQGVLFENRVRLAGGVLTAALEEKADAFQAQADGNANPAFNGKRSQNASALGYGIQSGFHALQFNVRQDRDSLFGSFQTGAASYGYAFVPRWRATFSFGSAFRAPTLEQLYSQYGSTQLQPETNRSLETGVQYAQGTEKFKAVVYRNEVNNMITSAQSETGCLAGGFCYYNVGRAVIQGITFSGSQQWGAYALRGAYDLLDPRDDISGRDLSLRARQMINLGVDRYVAQWRLGAEFKGVGQRFNNAANSELLPAYSLFNVVMTRPLGRDWKIVARADNLANTKYQQVLNYATPGRTVFVGLNWQPR